MRKDLSDHDLAPASRPGHDLAAGADDVPTRDPRRWLPCNRSVLAPPCIGLPILGKSMCSTRGTSRGSSTRGRAPERRKALGGEGRRAGGGGGGPGLAPGDGGRVGRLPRLPWGRGTRSRSPRLYGRSVALIGRGAGRGSGSAIGRSDATRPGDSSARALTPATRLVFAETLSNPLVRLADIPGLAEVARAAGARLVIDHTFAPLLCRPLELGAEAVTHSATKLIGGHSDLTLGLLAGSHEIVGRASAVATTFGLTGNPFESWLALRGESTLALRSARACASALTLAERLSAHEKVRAVHYPGLETHPDHAPRRAAPVRRVRDDRDDRPGGVGAEADASSGRVQDRSRLRRASATWRPR